MFNLWLIILHYWDPVFPSTLQDDPWITRFSSLAGGSQHYSQPCACTEHYSLCSLWALSRFCTRTYWQYSTESWRVVLCRSLESCSLSSSALQCSAWQRLATLNLLASYLHLLNSESPWSPPGIPSWNVSQGSTWGNCRAHLFPSLRVDVLHCLINGQCFENYCFVPFVYFLKVSKWEVNLVFVTTSWS